MLRRTLVSLSRLSMGLVLATAFACGDGGEGGDDVGESPPPEETVTPESSAEAVAEELAEDVVPEEYE